MEKNEFEIKNPTVEMMRNVLAGIPADYKIRIIHPYAEWSDIPDDILIEIDHKSRTVFFRGL